MTYYDRDALDTFIAEVSGELRDRPMRAAIDGKIRHFFKCIDEADWDGVRMHLSLDAKLIGDLVGPGDIFIGIDRVMKWFTEARNHNQLTAHQLLLIDRGRVTCYVTHFWSLNADDMDSKPEFCKTREVYIIDLDDSHQIRRFERRYHEQDELLFDGGFKEMKRAFEKAELHAIELKETF
ncbi:uncharacterized protein LY79DRAFT_583379 [Colletotrichum navitas]|uniref:SnoaL-like domain-containing protein n=1 Tax=Colletotrichum navitas TaxID=681940 RepID=A0AAD8PPE7_9PEZI|nr:uncharacterized protein LY79DRAFT_583379 [Colletotrichum navitas]KAK1573886.1 hypothetical protein LY79DRAFT_583379 [Colletotrichum navitas]